jgi:hypothetical protein
MGSPTDQARKAIEAEAVGARVLGTVLNFVPVRGSGYGYGSAGYGYGYGYESRPTGRNCRPMRHGSGPRPISPPYQRPLTPRFWDEKPDALIAGLVVVFALAVGGWLAFTGSQAETTAGGRRRDLNGPAVTVMNDAATAQRAIQRSDQYCRRIPRRLIQSGRSSGRSRCSATTSGRSASPRWQRINSPPRPYPHW